PQTTPPTQPIANTNDNKPTPPPPAIKSPDPKPADPPLEKTNVTPIKEIPPEKETPLPPPTQSTSDDLSYTLVTREDRFPTRIPKNKQLITPEKQPPPEEKPVEKPIEKPIETPPVEKPVIPEPEVVKPTPPEVLPEPTIPKEIIYQRISDLSDLSEVEQLILSYYNLASADSMLVTYLIGVSANSVGDYENAIYYLKQIPETDVHYDDAIRLLYDSYKNMGDEANAALYSSLLKEETKTTFNIYDIPIKLWMILCLAVFTLVLGIITGSIFHTLRKSKKEELVSVDDFEVHSQNIQKAYETKEIFTEEPPQKSDNPVDLYENPPIITEELNEAEEIELIAEEQKALSEAPPEVIEETPPPPLPPEEPEEYLDPYSDEEYRKKMILKLHNDGWALEEIAKELQISQREIQLIIKMNA
ncbi:MAG: hypothetical protein FWG20_05780, partial [Candidatus Cloacimonetes bacterium]|nr:hypothetical protein [Candidatus Cloacimonadota bacterium]